MVKNLRCKNVVIYADEKGYEPFTTWVNRLRNAVGRKRILARIARVEQGNFGDHSTVGNGVSELRIFFGPGYRVYYGEDSENVVILLCGGDKGSQKSDIKKAKLYWKDCKEND